MKISQLVETNQKTPYYENLASRLPGGIKSQQELLNIGYRVAVKELGYKKASALSEAFAIKLVNSYHRQCLEEGIGSFLGKAAGHVVGAVGAAGRGIGNAWKDAKQGYQDAKGSWDPTAGSTGGGAASGSSGTAPTPATGSASAGGAAAGGAAAGGAPAAGGATVAPGAAGDAVGSGASPGGATPTPPAAGTPPTTGSKGVGDIMKAIDGLDPASKKQLAGELDKSIKAAPPAGAEDPNSGTKTGTTNPGDWAAGGRDASAADHATPADVKPAAGGTTPQPDELDAVKKNAGLPTGTTATTPAGTTATPAGTTATPAGATTPAAKAPVTGTSGGAGKSMMDLRGAGVSDPSQLANLQKTGAANLAAQKGAANMNIQKPTFAADKRTPAQIAKMKQAGFREDVEFHSNFLGHKI